MVKHQIHDEFKTFTGTSILELSKTAADFAAQAQVAIKSISVAILPSSSSIILSLGYNSHETWYPISIDGASIRTTPGDFDENIATAAECMAGDVICHSLYVNVHGLLEVAFLLHE